MPTVSNAIAHFIHVSDLHLASSPSEAKLINQKWEKYPRLLHGFLAHHPRVADSLSSFVRRSSHDKLLFTGDLTAHGSEAQFEFGRKYLEKTLSLKEKEPIKGLGFADWLRWSIPGNHDHWPGRVWPPLGNPTQGLNDTFGLLPNANTWFTLNKSSFDTIPHDVKLRFLRINTDADIKSKSPDKLFARGDFLTQLNTLATELDPCAPNEVRILMLHHSCHCEKKFFLKIKTKSLAALRRFVSEHKIALLLSGHIHNVKFSQSNRSPSISEITCGTTTKYQPSSHDRSNEEYMQYRAINPNAGIELNTLLLHRILEKNDGLYWHAETYRYNSTAFVSYKEDEELVSQKERFEAEFKLWPH